MNKKIGTSFLTILILLFIGCTNKEASNETENTTQEQNDTYTLQLDDGKKWKVDNHMMEELRKIETIVNNSNTENNTLSLDEIADSLIIHLDLLTSNCTMQGQAHDELHKWLVPFIGLVNEFANHEDNLVGRAQISMMEISFKEFNRYFE